jgi:hypothetical protein
MSKKYFCIIFAGLKEALSGNTYGGLKNHT